MMKLCTGEKGVKAVEVDKYGFSHPMFVVD